MTLGDDRVVSSTYILGREARAATSHRLPPAPPPDNRASAIGTTSDFTGGLQQQKNATAGPPGRQRARRGHGTPASRRVRRTAANGADTAAVYEADLDSDHRSQPAAGDAPGRGEVCARSSASAVRGCAKCFATSGTRASGDADAESRGNRVQNLRFAKRREVFAARQVLEAGNRRRVHRVGHPRRLQNGFTNMLHVSRPPGAGAIAAPRSNPPESFTLIIAEIAGNQILVDMLRDLVSRSSLIIAVYQAPGARCCPPDERIGGGSSPWRSSGASPVRSASWCATSTKSRRSETRGGAREEHRLACSVLQRPGVRHEPITGKVPPRSCWLRPLPAARTLAGGSAASRCNSF